MTSYLFASCSRRGKPQRLLNVLSDGHGAEDVEEDEAAVGHVVSQQVSVAEALDPVDGVKGSFATTRPSKMELNIERRAVKAKPKHSKN